MSGPLRVLHVLSHMDRGGLETRTMELYRHINRSRVQFDFAVHTDRACAFDGEIRALGGILHQGFKRFKAYNIIGYHKQWASFFRRHPQYSILHIHLMNSAGPIMLAARKNKVKTIICHALSSGEPNALKRLWVRLNRPLWRQGATERLAASDEAGRFIFKSGYKVLHHAIEAGDYTFDPKVRAEVRREFNLAEDAFVVGQVASFQALKNHKFMLEVFARLWKELPRARLMLVGEGALFEKIREQVRRLGLSEAVILTGVRDDVPRLVQAMDALALPSFYEGLPGVALEAQAGGLPTLLSATITREASVVPDLAEYLPITDAALWAGRLKALAEAGKERRDTYEDFCRAGFDVKAAARWLENFYLEKENSS